MTEQLDREFVPSRRLIDVFIEGAQRSLDDFRTERGEGPIYGERIPEDDRAAFELTPENVADVIAERIVDVLVSLVQRRRAGVLKYEIIASDHFHNEVRDELLELLPLGSGDGERFCVLLLEEFKDYLRTGGELSTRGGSVALGQRGELKVVVTKPLRARPVF
jgi:hypothetical protein